MRAIHYPAIEKPEANKFVHHLRQIGIAGFLFFLAKGLLWIALSLWIAL